MVEIRVYILSTCLPPPQQENVGSPISILRKHLIIALSAHDRDHLQRIQLWLLSIRGLYLRQSVLCTATIRFGQREVVVDLVRSGFHCFILFVVCLPLESYGFYLARSKLPSSHCGRSDPDDSGLPISMSSKKSAGTRCGKRLGDIKVQNEKLDYLYFLRLPKSEKENKRF